MELMQKCHEKALRLKAENPNHMALKAAAVRRASGRPAEELAQFIRRYAPETRDPKKPSTLNMFSAYEKFHEELEAALDEEPPVTD